MKLLNSHMLFTAQATAQGRLTGGHKDKCRAGEEAPTLPFLRHTIC